MKTPLKWEWNSHQNPRNPESPKQDKPKVKHPKTHTNQIFEIKHKKQILKQIVNLFNYHLNNRYFHVVFIVVQMVSLSREQSCKVFFDPCHMYVYMKL